MTRLPKLGTTVLLAAALVVPFALGAATVGTLTNFTNGQLADAAAVNANFDALKTTVNANAIAKIAGAYGDPCSAAEEGTQRYNSTSKKMEFCNGTVWSALGGAGLKAVRVFGSNGTWTKPAGVTSIEVIVTGGGGGGGSHNTDDAQGGGGAGGTAIKVIDVTSVTSVPVTIGAGGAGAQANTFATALTQGGTSSFGAYCSATGGQSPTNWAVGGLGGAGFGGDINLRGNDGDTGSIDGGGNEESGGTGGASYWGGAGTGGSYWAAGRAGLNGSGGGGTHVQTSNVGFAGGSGLVVVREFGP